MAPVALKPSRFAGGISQGRIVPSNPLDALAAALDATSNLVVTGAKLAKADELEDALSLLENPLMTVNETIEAEHAVRFPLAKLKFQNRRGAILAGKRKAELADLMSKAPNALEARRVARDHQRDTLFDAAGSEGVQAGIREAYAQFIPTLLSDASKRRVVEQERQEQIDVGELQTLAFAEGPKQFAATLLEQVSNEVFVGGDVAGLYARTVFNLENSWLAGIDDTDITGNRTSLRVRFTINAILNDPEHKMKDATRRKFSKLGRSIALSDEANLTSAQADLEDSNKIAFLAAFKDLDLWRSEHPGIAYPSDRIDRARLVAPTPTEVTRFTELAYSSPDPRSTTGVGHTQIWGDRRSLLLTSVRASALTGGFLLATGPNTMRAFDEAGRALPVSLLGDDDKLAAEADRFAVEATKQGIEMAAASSAARLEFKTNKIQVEEEAQKFFDKGDFKGGLAFIQRQSSAFEKLLGEQHRLEIAKWIASHGFDTSAFTFTHEE